MPEWNRSPGQGRAKTARQGAPGGGVRRTPPSPVTSHATDPGYSCRMSAAPAHHPAATPSLQARAWLYVLVANGHEDLIKVGLTSDPLARWSAFHPRWYDAFDLRHSLLVACESRRDAQRLETALHRVLAEQRCPMPLTMRTAAAGASEWYRGAYPRARRFAEDCEAQGHPVHRDAREVLAPAMQAQAERLHGLLQEAHRGLLDGWLQPGQCRAMVDLVDGHCRFDPALAACLPQPAWQDLQRANLLHRDPCIGG